MKTLFRSCALAALLTVTMPAFSFVEVAQAVEKKAVTTTAPVKRLGTKGTVGGGAVALTTSDCKLLLSGTVVEVTDGRCGASGKYCKSSVGSACITE